MYYTANAIKYTIEFLANIAFPNTNYCILTAPQPTILVDNKYSVVFANISVENFTKLLKKNALFTEVDSYDDKAKVKVFFLPEKRSLFVVDGNKIIVNADFLSISFILLSRCEELLEEKRDKHGRFRFCDSVNCAYNLIDIPLVDEYAMLIRKQVETHYNISIKPRKSSVIPTHDIDFFERFPNFTKSIKTIAGDLLVRRNRAKMWQSMKDYFARLKNKNADPYIKTVYELVKVAKEQNQHTIFFFKALTKGEKDATYDILSQQVRTCIDYIKSCGLEIALHAGYFSYNDVAVFSREKARLVYVCDMEINAVRQHFLRFSFPESLKIWQQNGILNDYTLGFAERAGFRCGTCHPYFLYDIMNDIPTQVIEHPLIIMDTTMYQYCKYTPQQAQEVFLYFQQRCNEVEGDFCYLKHNVLA